MKNKKNINEDVIIIPARGNSKGIKKKNLISFCGKPLLYWTILQAKKTKISNNVYVSSEDDRILNLAKSWGAKVIKRPANLSKDSSSSESAISHFLSQLLFVPKNIVFLQATSPLRYKHDIDSALTKFKKEKSDSLFSCHMAEDYFDIWKLKDKKYKPMTINYMKRKPRQLFKEKHFCQNGSIYIFSNSIFKKNKNRLGGKINVYTMKEWQSFQLDSIEQKSIMEIIFKNKLKKFYE